MEGGHLVIVNHGSKALFVLRTRKDVDPRQIRAQLERYARQIEEHL
jgi:predicted regulator of Ras-like GTPase activity (Roadblock/LC7/MglB family)